MTKSNLNNIQTPFKFLDYYQKEDGNIFFGREEEVQELYARIHETNLVLLYGASGTGKTSIINCGLNNEFEASDWLPIYIRRQETFISAISHEVQEVAIKKNPSNNIIAQIESLYLDYFKTTYLIIDQFEEIFILGSKEEQIQFFELLNTILEKRNLKCKVILIMREEYLAYLSDFEYIIPNLFDNRLRIEKMNTKKLEDVIKGTLHEFGIQMPPNEKIPLEIIKSLRDKNNEVDLANLQVYLDRLYRIEYERRIQENREYMTFDKTLLAKAGNFENVMSLFLDEQISILEKELSEKGIMESGIPMEILFTMVTDTGTKQAIEVQQIKKQLMHQKNISEDIIDFCIKRFNEIRILRILSSPTPVPMESSI